MIQFTVCPVRHRPARGYFVVTVLPTKTAYRRYVRSRGRAITSDGVAVFMGRQRYGDHPSGHRTRRYRGEIATSLATLRAKGVTVATHELGHATIAWAHHERFLARLPEPQTTSGRPGRYGYLMARQSAEERFCYALGSMCSQFVTQGYRHGVWS